MRQKARLNPHWSVRRGACFPLRQLSPLVYRPPLSRDARWRTPAAFPDSRPADRLRQPRFLVGPACFHRDFALLSPTADHYAPMDAAALKHYGFLRKLGLFRHRGGTRARSRPVSARCERNSVHAELRSLGHAGRALHRHAHPSCNLPSRAGSAGRSARRMHPGAAGLRVHLLG